MATEKQVQSLAKQLVLLVGKIDKDYEKKSYEETQEAVNELMSKTWVKKNEQMD
jgi:translation elongation factor EF-1alpha